MNSFTEIFMPPNYQRKGLQFFQAYHIEQTIVCPDVKVKGLIPKTKRTCRFCKLKYDEVLFKKDAHLISEFLGNKYLLSDFECDNCNEIFSNYESHLAHFLGPHRAFQKLFGSNERYKFKSPNKKLTAENFKLYGLENSFSISREDVKDQTFEFDREAGTTLIRFTKHSYSPIFLYKSILKIALSCLRNEDVADYDLAFKYLLSKKYDHYSKGISKLLSYSYPPGIGHKVPFANLYRKNNDKQKIFTHVFELTFMNHIFQMVIPFNKNDLVSFTDETIPIFFSPPMFYDSATANTIQIKDQLLDLSCKKLEKNEQEVIGFKYDVDEYSKGVAYDFETNEIKEGTFDPDSVKQIVIMPKSAFLDLPINKKKSQ